MSNDEFPTTGRLAGIDYGTVRVGVAVTDVEQRLASPFENYQLRDLRLDAQYFQQFVEAESVVGFVVGLPVHSSGDESEKSKEARAYGAWLTEVTQLPVTFFDERYTSAQAEEMLGQAGVSKKKRKQRLDMLAAQIMLAAYLESSRDSAAEALDD